MGAAGFAKAFDQGVVIGIDEDHFVVDILLAQFLEQVRKVGEAVGVVAGIYTGSDRVVVAAGY